MRYNNYHKHTHYSNIMTPDCVVKPIDYVNRAIELGHSTLFTTEHGYSGNLFEYYDLAKKNGLKFVFGIEYYYVKNRHEKDRSNSHLMVVAKNIDGMQQMLNIQSEAGRTGYYHKPRVDQELILSLNPNNVIVTTACIASYISYFDDYEETYLLPFKEHFKSNFFLEVQNHYASKQITHNQIILPLSEKYNIPIMHANDSHYIYPEQKKYRDLFLLGKNIKYPDEEEFILDYPDYETVISRYERQGVLTKSQAEEAVRNTLIFDQCEEIHLNKDIKMPSIYPDLSIDEKHEKLRETLRESWREKAKDIPKEEHKKYFDRINYELGIIESTAPAKTVDYFLLNHKIIKRAKELGGILTRTGRGSAPSMYMNNLLGFTEIDAVNSPIPLYPTRFMSATRILETRSLPDIDFNVANPEPFIVAMKEILGEDNIYPMIKFGTMQEKEAFRNMCRALEIDNDTQDMIAKDLDSYREDPKWKTIIEDSKNFIDVIHSAAYSTSSYVLLDESISENIGLVLVGSEDGKDKNGKKKEKVLACVIDSSTSDDWKFLKNDVLPVVVWEIISKVFEEVGEEIPDTNKLDKMIGDNVWNLFEQGDTVTLNQVGTDSGTPQIMRYKPKNIAELSAWVAAIRPGFKSMKDIFLDRQPFSYGIGEFDKLLESSSNFCLYQENVMATLIFAGFPEDETYGIIKKISKKKDLGDIKDKFIDGFTERTGSHENALKVWQVIEDNADYSFNSSHSVSVAYDCLYGGYLKANHPLEYYAVISNIYENNTEITSKIYKELPHFGIKIAPIKFRQSRAHYSANKIDNTIVKGLKSIKYLNERIAEELYELRDNDYETFIDLLVDVTEKTSCNTRQMNILIRLNFFSEFGEMGKLIGIFNAFSDGEMKYDKKYVDTTKQKRLHRLYEFEKIAGCQLISIPEQIAFEKDHLGYIVSSYPDADKSLGVVLDADTKFAPRYTIYLLKAGKEIVYKISNMDLDRHDDGIRVNDMIEILKGQHKPKKKKIDGKWTPTSETEPWITQWRVVERKEAKV